MVPHYVVAIDQCVDNCLVKDKVMTLMKKCYYCHDILSHFSTIKKRVLGLHDPRIVMLNKSHITLVEKNQSPDI